MNAPGRAVSTFSPSVPLWPVLPIDEFRDRYIATEKPLPEKAIFAMNEVTQYLTGAAISVVYLLLIVKLDECLMVLEEIS